MKSTDRESRPVKRRRQANGKMPGSPSSKPAEPIRRRSRRAAGPSLTRSQITDRQLAEEALLESEEKYRNVVERANDGIAIIQDTIVRYLNPRLAELWGGTVAKIIGRPFADYVHPDELPVVLDRYKRRMAGEEVIPTYETGLKRKDGSKVYVELNAGTIMFHGEPADLVIVRDITQRKQAENKLTAERNLLSTVIDHLPDNIFVKDVNGRIVIDNSAHRRLLGASTLEAVVGKTDFDFFAGNLAASYDADEKEIIRSGKVLINREEPTVDRDGEQRWLLTTKLPLRDHEGKITGIVGINRDITERKRAEEALRQAEAKYRNIVDNATEGIYQSTPAGSFFTANPSLARMLGYDSPEELIAGVNNLNHEFYVQPGRREEFVRQLSKHGTISNFESQVYRKDGSQIWMSENARAVLGAEGHLHYEGTLVDITERKCAEEALRIAEANYRSLFENSPVGIYQTTPQGRPLAVNQALARIVGHDSPQEVLDGTNNVEQQFYVDPASRRQFRRLIEEQGQVREFSSQARRRDGGIIWVQESARVVRDAQGNTLYYEGFMTDITERKQADEELKQLSTHDSLTGLYSRGFFMVEMARLERGREFPVSILMADVDHLKQTNDQEGHDAGDALLKRVAQVLTATFRVEDVVARIGGDEFAVLLPATDAASAEVSLQRVRRVIQENNAANAETPIHLSLGVSTAENPAPLSVVLKEADAKMYREKRGNVGLQENQSNKPW